MATLQDALQNIKNEIISEVANHREQVQAVVDETKEVTQNIASDLEQRIARIEAFIGSHVATNTPQPVQAAQEPVQAQPEIDPNTGLPVQQ